jgi:hypothetical protein
MALTGNKGEWSEIYALFKILGDGQVYAGDENLNKIETLFYPIIKILRTEVNGNFVYSYIDDIVLISSESNLELLRLPVSIFSQQAIGLLQSIKNSSGSFSIKETEDFMHLVYCQTLKAKSTDKADIRIVIHDLKTNIQSLLGFSIKSQLGSASTLLNAGRTTNIIYKINGISIINADIERINSIQTVSKIKDRITTIKKLNNTLVTYDFENSIFKNNLTLIDSALPEIISEIIKRYFSSNLSTIKEIVEELENDNPLGYDNRFAHRFYEYKVKRFLTDIALGMTPSNVWSGIYDANGGYLIVKEDGDVLCYHIYNKNEFENYLFANTKLDTASSTRHDFGVIYKIGDEQFFKLNLQIRFK